MKNLQAISDDISIAGQPLPEEIAQLSEQGVRTVINLRTIDEEGFLPDEERLVEAQGVNFSHIPVAPDTLDDIAVSRFSQALSSVGSTPAIVHCGSGGRAGLMTLLHLATTHGWSIEKAIEEGEKHDIEPRENSPYRKFFEAYLKRHSAGER